MIPEFDHNGVLPAHVGHPASTEELSPYPYPVTSRELVERFGFTRERRRILHGLLQIENFSSRGRHVILQDVHAKILTKNLVLYLAGLAQAKLDAQPAPKARRCPRKHHQQVNQVDALHLCKMALVQLIVAPCEVAFDALLERMTRYRHSERPRRTYARVIRRGCATNRFPMAYKSTA